METTVLKFSLVLSLLFVPLSAWTSPRMAHWLRARQHIRPEGPFTHGRKAGTPTMGGLVPLGLLLGGAGILWAWTGPDGPSIFAVLATVLAGGVGLLDDLRSQRRHRSTGLFPHQTILVQLLAATILVFVALLFPPRLQLPFSSLVVSLPTWGWIPLLVLGFLGTLNGVNLADGLDGLASGLFLLALLGLLPCLLGMPKLGALGILGLGSGLGFLWSNAFPARVFLGNVGSMGLGGFLFGLAWSSESLLFLPLAGGVFVLEALSVILQVGSFKLWGVRLFKMSPFHHHLEDMSVPWPHRLPSPNWPEPQVVTRLWAMGAGFALLSVLAAL